MYFGIRVKYPLILSGCNEIFLTDFSKNTLISNFVKIRPVGAEFFHADGQTGIEKLVAIFRNYGGGGRGCRKDIDIPTPKYDWLKLSYPVVRRK